MKNKDLAFLEFRKINERSWTYNRLTEAEKKAWSDTLASTAGTIKGTYNSRYQQLLNLYTAFLYALGYNENPISWREPNPESIPQF